MGVVSSFGVGVVRVVSTRSAVGVVARWECGCYVGMWLLGGDVVQCRIHSRQLGASYQWRYTRS